MVGTTSSSNEKDPLKTQESQRNLKGFPVCTGEKSNDLKYIL